VPLIEQKTLEVELLACVVDVNSDKVAVCVVVEDESFRELFAQGLSVLGGVLPINSNGRYGGPYYGGKTDIVGSIRAGS
jgi:hypothetical protein